MLKTLRVMLIPNNEQRTRLFQFAGTARFAYNWALEQEKKNHDAGGKFLSDYELRKRFTQFKNEPNNQWLYTISNNVCKQAVKDAVVAYQRFFKGLAEHPKFKSRRRNSPKFYADPLKIKFTATHVKLENIAQSRKKKRQSANWFRLAERDRKTSRVRRLKKKQRRLQRKISRKYEKNKKGACYEKTRNIKKSEKQLLRITHRLTDIRTNYIHQVTTAIIKREPSFIVMEDLNVKGMMKNKHLARAVQEQKFAEFYRIMQYKCEWHGIKFMTVDRFYPSSKTCSVCGSIKKDLKLSERVYHCENCGTVIDRDMNASINLYQYGKSIINH